jgi:3-hydroxyisobutyrate dehydrogenase-like beta-hydroxyacid dehydrogenase
MVGNFDAIWKEIVMKIGLVGLGRMGGAMVQRLKKMDCDVIGWDINTAAIEKAVANGLTPVSGPAEVANTANHIISIITEDTGVRSIFQDENGFLSTDLGGKLFIEMSTCRPMTSRELAPKIESAGARIIDCPVLGTIPQVLEGKLHGLAGGSSTDLEHAMPVLKKLTQSVRHMGKLGNGCAMKLSINMGMVAYMQSLAEALALGQQQGLTQEQMLDVMSLSPIASGWLDVKTPILKGEKGPVSLDLRTMRKDMMSAVATGTATGVPLPAASGALSSISSAVGNGWGDLDIAELPRFFREHMVQSF